MGGVAWTEEEDQLLKKCVEQFGEGKWHRIPVLAGLNRCRKSCRLRWLNYLRPNIRRGSFTEDEVKVIIKLHKLVGNKWSFIAGRLPGRTANDIKNYWNCHLSKNLTKKDDVGDQLIDNISDIEPQLGNLATRMMTIPSSSSTTPTTLEEETAAKAIAAEPSSDQKENREEEEEDFRAKNRSLSEVSSYMDHQWEMDYDFAEVKMTTTAAHQDYGNTTTNLEFDDLIFDMDLWVNSV